MRKIVYILACMVVLAACSRTPKGVLGKSDMANLMADIHVAEGVVNNNQSEYASDSMKLMLKQSVFAKHGVTEAEFDSSLMWYGQHLDKYIDVYDDVIKILEKRNAKIGNAIVAQRGSMAGDSVDVWPGTRYAKLNNRLPSQLVAFDLAADANSSKGDTYTWRIKICDDESQNIHWTIVAEYDDNSIDWYMATSGGRGWNEIVYAADSTLTLKNIKGYFTVDRTSQHYGMNPSASRRRTQDVYIDSISLIRKRVNPDDYRYRARLRHYPEMK